MPWFSGLGDAHQRFSSARLLGLATTTMLLCCSLLGCQSSGPATHPTTPAADAFTKPADMLRLADAMRRGGQSEAAVKAYRKVIDQGGDSYDVRMGLGAAISDEGDLTAAAVEFRTAEAMQPTRAEPFLSLGRIGLLQHKPEQALAEFDAGLKLSPGAIAGWNGKGYALDMLERHEEAQEAYRTGLAGAPDDHVLQNNYGLSLTLSGDYPAAIKILTALVQEPGATSRNRQNLALALGLQGNKEDASFVSRTDLDKSAIENNLRYYDAMRRVPVPTQSAKAPAIIAAPEPAPPTITTPSASSDNSVSATPLQPPAASPVQPANASGETVPAPLVNPAVAPTPDPGAPAAAPAPAATGSAADHPAPN